MEEHQILIFLSAMLVLGIAAQWLAWRLRLPSILLLLGFGFSAGYFGGADPDHLIGTDILFPVVSLAVAVIMFEGGMSLHFGELKEAGRVVLSLVTIGVLVSWVLIGVFCYFLIGMSWQLSCLTGAILVVTGPTVIGPLLRSIRPVKRLGSIVKWEGIVIDPVGAVLAVLVYTAVIQEKPTHVLPDLIKITAIGVVLGCGIALVMVQLLKRYWLPDFLHNPAFLAVAIGSFALSNVLAEESGLVTVTVLGIALRNQKSVAVRHVVEFKENLRVLLISCLFIVLAARIKLEDLTKVGLGGILFLVALILVVRPLSVFISTLRSDLTLNEKTFLAFLAPRGIVAAAVSSVFALKVSEKVPGAETIVTVTFLVIVGTVAVYGLLARPFARFLELAVPNPQGVLFAGAASWVQPIAEALMEEGINVLLVDTNYRNISTMRQAGIPAQCASILSEYVAEEMDLSTLGKMLAVTPNDDLNSLATVEFAQIFGRKEIYQLSPWDTGPGRSETPAHIRGRYLFTDDITHGDMAFRFASGAQVKRTKITDEFSYESFTNLYGATSVLLFVISETGDLNVVTAGEQVTPKAGQTVIALVDEPNTSSSSK